MIRSFRDLEVYTLSYALMLDIHKILLKMPTREKFDLVSQMSRAAKSIPANIAEGWAKRTHIKEFKKHLLIALGSANEMEVHIDTTRDLSYFNAETCQDLINRYQLLGGKLSSLIKNWH